MAAAAAAKSLQSYMTLCDPVDSSPPGSPVPGILQVRTLEWVAISFSNAWKWKVKVKSLSHVRLFVTPWTVAYQAPPSMGFSRQEYWSGVPLPSPKINLKRCHLKIFKDEPTHVPKSKRKIKKDFSLKPWKILNERKSKLWTDNYIAWFSVLFYNYCYLLVIKIRKVWIAHF